MIWVYIIGAIVVIIGLSAFFGAPYVPSHRKDIQKLLDNTFPISKDDVVLDLGSGDGIVLREVSRRGGRAVGYEIHPLFVAISKLLSWRDPRVTIELANVWTAPFPDDVTLVYAFSVARDSKRMIRKMQSEANRLERVLRLASYGNALPGATLERTVGAYHLYRFEPLHRH